MNNYETNEFMIKEYQKYWRELASKFDEPIKNLILNNFDNFLLLLNKNKNLEKNEILNLLSNYKADNNLYLIDNLNDKIDKIKLKKKINARIILNDKMKCNNIEYENLIYFDKIYIGFYYEILDFFIKNFIQDNIKGFLIEHLFINKIEFSLKLDNYDKINYVCFLMFFENYEYDTSILNDMISSLKNICLYFYNLNKDDRMKTLFKIFNFIQDNLEDRNNLLNILNNLANYEEFLVYFKLLIVKLVCEIINFLDEEKLNSIFYNLNNINYDIVNIKKLKNSFKFYLLKKEEFDMNNYENKIYFMIFIKFLLDLYNWENNNVILNILKTNELFKINEHLKSKISLIVNINNFNNIENFIISYNYNKENIFQEIEENNDEDEDEIEEEKKGFDDFIDDNEELKIDEFYKSQISNNNSDIDVYEINDEEKMISSNLSNWNINTKNKFNFWFDWIKDFNNNIIK